MVVLATTRLGVLIPLTMHPLKEGATRRVAPKMGREGAPATRRLSMSTAGVSWWTFCFSGSCRRSARYGACCLLIAEPDAACDMAYPSSTAILHAALRRHPQKRAGRCSHLQIPPLRRLPSDYVRLSDHSQCYAPHKQNEDGYPEFPGRSWSVTRHAIAVMNRRVALPRSARHEIASVTRCLLPAPSCLMRLSPSALFPTCFLICPKRIKSRLQAGPFTT